MLVQRRLGHTDPTTTLKVYGHLYPSAESALADALDAIYESDAGSVAALPAAV